MALSFAALWTLILIIAVITTIVHQVNYQDSPDKIHLELEVKALESDIRERDAQIRKLETQLEHVTEWWYYP